MSLNVNEIFYSIQGESTWSGLPFIFIRLSGCNLRCSYCDTKYSYDSGEELSVDEVINRIAGYPVKNVEITGGEPLMQEDTVTLIDRLVKSGYKVLIETNGSVDISRVNRAAIRIMDIKCPGSGEEQSFGQNNIAHLKPDDEVKFVVTSREDYDYAKGMIEKFGLIEKCKVIISAAYDTILLSTLANWILMDGLDIKLQTQLHKLIFGDIKGV